MFLKEVLKLLDEGEIVYILDEYEEAVFRFEPNAERDVYIRRSNKGEKKIDWESDIACEARLGGKIITQDKYYNY